jgi:hypothetical protein
LAWDQPTTQPYTRDIYQIRKAPQDSREYKGTQGRRALLVTQGHRAPEVMRDILVILEYREHRDTLGSPAFKDPRVPPVCKDLQGMKDRRGRPVN